MGGAEVRQPATYAAVEVRRRLLMASFYGGRPIPRPSWAGFAVAAAVVVAPVFLIDAGREAVSHRQDRKSGSCRLDLPAATSRQPSLSTLVWSDRLRAAPLRSYSAPRSVDTHQGTFGQLHCGATTANALPAESVPASRHLR